MNQATLPPIAEQVNSRVAAFRKDLFAYYETDDETDDPSTATADAVDPVQREWWVMMAPYMECNPDHSPRVWPMREMFYMA